MNIYEYKNLHRGQTVYFVTGIDHSKMFDLDDDGCKRIFVIGSLGTFDVTECIYYGYHCSYLACQVMFISKNLFEKIGGNYKNRFCHRSDSDILTAGHHAFPYMGPINDDIMNKLMLTW
jgi:hypothetical protein